MEYLHDEMEIMHRDIKPDNIMVNERLNAQGQTAKEDAQKMFEDCYSQKAEAMGYKILSKRCNYCTS